MVIPLMIAGVQARIVNVSSSTGVQPDLSRTYYGVAKAAVNMLTHEIAVPVRKTGNPMQCKVLPGFTVSKATGKPCRKSFESWLKHYMIRRLGSPQDQ